MDKQKPQIANQGITRNSYGTGKNPNQNILSDNNIGIVFQDNKRRTVITPTDSSEQIKNTVLQTIGMKSFGDIKFQIANQGITRDSRGIGANPSYTYDAMESSIPKFNSVERAIASQYYIPEATERVKAKDEELIRIKNLESNIPRIYKDTSYTEDVSTYGKVRPDDTLQNGFGVNVYETPIFSV